VIAFDVPPPWSFLAEGLFAWDVARSPLALPELARAPRGCGDPVLVLPGYAASDLSTTILRGALRALGHDARGWGLGRNGGNVPKLVPRLVRLAERLADETQRSLRIVGWSLGGVLAREVARERPELVARVVTLGSPVVGGPKYTAVGRMFRQRGANLDAIEAAVAERERARPLRVPVTAVYSRRDGVVSWRACIDSLNPGVEHVEVSSTHAGLGFQPEVLAIVARRLAG
jgi:pimeloyl-ACP methyl ester carboxylesterase